MKNSFVFYTEWIEQIRLLEKHGTQKDLDAFWEAIRAYVEEGAADPETAMAELTFVPLRNQIARDAAKYEEISEKRRQARTKDNKQEQTITNHNKQEQRPTNATEDEDDDEDDDVSPKGDNNISSISLPIPQYEAPTNPAKMTDKVLEEEFDALWMLYPRKAGKADALRHYKAARKNGTAYEDVEQGIIRYTRHIEDEHTDPQYIAMGSTWFNGHRWEDQYPRGEPKVGSLEWLANIQ